MKRKIVYEEILNRPADSLVDALIQAGTFDGRDARGLDHPLGEILICIIVGLLCMYHSYRGINSFLDPKVPDNASDEYRKHCEEDAAEVLECFREHGMEFPNGIPSYSCMSRALAVTDNEGLSIYICDLFYQMIPKDTQRRWAIDGKALRASVNKALVGKSNYIINVLDVASQIVVFSFAVGDKTNEASCLAQKLGRLIHDVNAMISTDAMGTRAEITEQIVLAGCDYTLPLKKNNKNLMETVQFVLEDLSVKDSALLSHYVDLEGFKESDTPSDVIVDPVVKVKDEDNENTDDPKTPDRTVDSLTFFDKVYKYDRAEYDKNGKLILPDCVPSEDSKLVMFLIGDRWVRMARNRDRYERREVEACSDPEIVGKIQAAYPQFRNIRTVAMVTRYRAKKQRINRKVVWVVTITRTPVISSKVLNAEEISKICREHWFVEDMHWVEDEYFREDKSTIRKGFGPENFSFLRKTALNLQRIVQRFYTKKDAAELISLADVRDRMRKLSRSLDFMFMPLSELNAYNPIK